MRALPVLVALVLAGCGGDKLTSDEREQVGTARITLSGVLLDAIDHDECIQQIGARCYEHPGKAIDTLVAIYRAKPDAKYDPGGEEGDDALTMRQVLEDTASALDEYEPDLAAELDRALAG